MDVKEQFREIIQDKRKLIETFFVVENKQRQLVPFRYNRIQDAASREETGFDIWVKPSQIGFSTERIANRLADTLTVPGTNTVLVAYEDFITQRLLAKVSFFYNHLANLGIPGFPEIYNDSEFLKSFRFYSDGKLIGISSIYVASARSKTAGRAESIHHLLLDEHAFYVSDSVDRVVAPAMARIPPGGTVDSFSTPNGEENEFYDWYVAAKSGKSIFTPHFFPWYLHDEYMIKLGDVRIKDIPETNKEEFKLDLEEEVLYEVKGLSFDQIRWRRWMNLVMDSLRKRGESKTLFKQEFPEDDVSCFLSTGDMYFDVKTLERMGDNCYPAPNSIGNLQIWFKPEKDGNYIVAIDPGQARISQTSITVLQMVTDEFGNPKIRYCARDAGLYAPEITVKKAIDASNYYNRCMITWEDNSHGLAITELLKNRKPIYMRRDIVSGVEMRIPGWRTTSGNKDYMLQAVEKYIYDMECYDLEFVRQCRNHRLINGKLEIVGYNDIFMSCAIGLVCLSPIKVKRGLVGTTGWKW
jgi:hypothetical protein